MLRLFIIRHGESISNSKGLWEGWTDSALTEEGRAQVFFLKDRLKGISFQAAYSSDLDRATQTAKILLSEKDIILKQDPVLRESKMGGLEHSYEPVDWSNPPKGLETFDNLLLRAQSFISQLKSTHHEGNILIVGHNGINKALIQFLRQQTEYPTDFSLPNAALSVISLEKNKVICEMLGDIAHLKA